MDELPNLDDFLEAGLAWLEGVTPYDLATVWQVDGDRLRVRMARGRLKSQRVLQHVVALSEHDDLRRVLQERLPRVNTAHDHADGEGDLFDGVVDLAPGHSCMVVPLAAGGQSLGLLSLDRNICETYSPEALRLVDLYARLLAFGMQVTERAQRLGQLYGEEQSRNEILHQDLQSAAAQDPVASFERTKNPRMRALIEQTRAAAASDSAILIRGETGTGKEVLAQAVHRWSRRADKPFLKINCASIPEAMLESELFGHVKGSFTGAVKDRVGRFRAADGGTLFLDEIGDMPLSLQAKLLRVLQEGTFEPVGSDTTVAVSVRIVCATHVDLEAAIRARTFREDLFYRINVFPVTLPPLRERWEDVPAIAEQILRRFRARAGRGARGPRLGERGLAQLQGYAWPGNVRELANVLERALIVGAGAAELDFAGLAGGDGAGLSPGTGLSPGPAKGAGAAAPGTLDEAMSAHIRRALDAAGGKIYGADGAAVKLGLKPSTLQGKMKRLGIGR